MPEHKKGETRQQWMNRCIPYVRKHEGLTKKQAAGKCGGMYDTWKKKQKRSNSMEYEEGREYPFKFDCPTVDFKFDADGKFMSSNDKGYNMVVAIGNRFMNGIYVSNKVLRECHKGFNNTPHDMNHMGTGYQASMFTRVPANISYVVGYQDDLKFDNASGEIRATTHISETAVRYAEWKSYVDICAKMGRTPNVSMFATGKVEYIEARKLPKGSHYGKHGYAAGDLVPCMAELNPVAVSTVFTGACSDKDGCGLANTCEDGNCNLNEEETNPEDELADLIEQKRRAYMEKRIKDLKGEEKHD